MHVGISDHLGWAVAVTAEADGTVIDRRRVELIEPGLPQAPVHHEGGAHPMHRSGPMLDDVALSALVATVRDSIVRTTATALDAIAAAAPEPIASLSLRTWPSDFPDDIATQRRVPYEARVDAIRYREVLADAGRDRGWAIHLYDSKSVEADASRIVGSGVLTRPRDVLGPPWARDHRVALAAAIVAAIMPTLPMGAPHRAHHGQGERRR